MTAYVSYRNELKISWFDLSWDGRHMIESGLKALSRSFFLNIQSLRQFVRVVRLWDVINACSFAYFRDLSLFYRVTPARPRQAKCGTNMVFKVAQYNKKRSQAKSLKR
jgi:hypothetical protein